MSDYNGGGKTPKKEKINEWAGQGIVMPRSGNEQDEIKFFPFQRGGGAIHITLLCKEIVGADENGNPKEQKAYIPVNVMSNKNITVQQLQSIRTGMKVKVVGKLAPESYTSKKTGQKVTALTVNAYVLEVLAMPQQALPPQGYGGPAYGGYPAPGAMPPQGGYPPYPQYGGAPMPGAMPGQYPGYPQYPGYGGAPAGAPPTQPQGQQGGQYPQYGSAPAAPAGSNIPPYYQPGPAAAPPAAAPPQGGAPGITDIDDLPPGI